jgi:ergothioneine biosynthesis protein EgtB
MRLATISHTAPAPLAERFRGVRRTTESLCEPLAVEDYVVQSMPDASPAKWHLAHTTWFFEEFVLQAFDPAHRFHDPRFRYLFNSYYQAVGPMQRRAERGVLSRPTVAETYAYRREVDERMAALLDSPERLEPRKRAALERVTMLGLHHEQQHQELLLTDLKHALSCNALLPAYHERKRPGDEERDLTVPAGFLAFDGGVREIGCGGEEFCFDNEQPRHRVFLEPYALAQRPVTNAEYLEFVRAGGYEQPQHWLSDGWATVQAQQWRHPLYWNESLAAEFTLAGLQPIDPRAPVVHVSYFEADAFARWAGARLASEAEWECAAAGAAIDGNFLDTGLFHPMPAAQPAAAGEPWQMFGDVWEWTRSPYSPYPGYRAVEGALGEYNGKFMVNQLVLRGGSCATPRSHIRASYRNFFAPAARWQMSGIRLAKDA